MAAVVLLLRMPVAGAQAFELSGGASTIYDAAGGTLLVHGENSETILGAGIQNHHLAAGGSLTRRTGDGTITLGMQQMRADVPTDIFAPTHVLVGLGAGLSRGSPEGGHQLRAFAGFSSVDGGSPLFTSGDIEKPTFFSQWNRRLGSHCRSVATAIDFRQVLALESVGCDLHAGGLWQIAGTAGGGRDAGYAAGSVRFLGPRLQLQAAYIGAGNAIDRSTVTYASIPEPTGANVSATYQLSRAWSFSGLHEHFMIPPFINTANASLDTPRERTSLDQVAIACHHGATDFSVSAISSALHFPQGQAGQNSGLASVTSGNASNTSLTATFEHNFGPLRWTENVVQSRESGNSFQRFSVSSLALRVNPHLLGSVSANAANGHLSFAPGGEWLTAATHVRVDYELLYLANRPDMPFQQAIDVNAGLRLWHTLGIEFATDISPTGTIGYTFRFTTFGARNAPAGQAGLGVQVGSSVLMGLVVDESGLPISGAALSIDKVQVFTDTTGSFCFRERRPALHTLHVSPDEFLTPGHFIVTSAPSRVSSQGESEARPLRIVVSRQPLHASGGISQTQEQGMVAEAEEGKDREP